MRGVKDYVRHHSTATRRTPAEHVLVYDEAQRAYDREMVAMKHPDMAHDARSEPELFVEFAERIPEWCVVVGLIGSGQEIHTGEEGGTPQWATAIADSPHAQEWVVHGPPALVEGFGDVAYRSDPALSLDVSLRSHLSFRVHEFVAGLVASEPPPAGVLAEVAGALERDGYDLRLTRDLAVAKSYLRERYADNPDARFGVVASSRDRDLYRFGIPNDFQSTKLMRNGPWYGDGESTPGGRSCRHLRDCVTEFGAQGLELDAVLLAWGTDFVRSAGRWNADRGRRYKPGGPVVRNAWQLRANAYRVLLTRARDATVVYVPALTELDATYQYLAECGFRPMAVT